MATKIRLQRHGKKGKAFFHLVAADSRAPRDGRYIEKLGTYNPNTDPATIDMDFDRTLHWVQVGAEMTDTARALLSYKGILHKNHLLNGVKKGALTAEQVEEKFAKWVEDKEGKIQGKKDSLSSADVKDKADRFKAETALKEARAAEIALKNTPEPEPEPVVEEAPVVEATEEAAPAVEAEAPATPEAPAAEETPEA
jgi:small subunit ribosomal protein S16